MGVMYIDQTDGIPFDPAGLALSWERTRRAGHPGPAQRLLQPWETALVQAQNLSMLEAQAILNIPAPIAMPQPNWMPNYAPALEF